MYVFSALHNRARAQKTINTAQFHGYYEYCLTTVCLFHCRSLSQYLKFFFRSVSIRKNSLKFCTFTSIKDSHQIPKNQISAAESLILEGKFGDR